MVSTVQPGDPSPHTERRLSSGGRSLPLSDTGDFADADRGFVAELKPGVVTGDDGRVVWDNDSFAYIHGTCPNSVNPSLWRQAQLMIRQGLYQVTDGIYQIRGLDLSNMTLVEGTAGVIVIDPLISTETAAAGLALYRQARGDRPVTGVIYTHSHVDHFGGVMGVTSSADVDAGRVPVLAPAGFVEHAVAENVFAGTAMARRAAYMYGAALPRDPKGQISAGLGMTTSTGTVTLIPPTKDITRTGQEEVIDGVRIVFQMTPGTEAPSEMNFYFPDHRALCMAENATHTLHNILTLRGAVVRDAHVWSQYLTEAINLFADKTDVAFASHHWPTWGTEAVTNWLALQRDTYGYLHDQTLRLLNQGYTGIEIAEMLEMPPALEKTWHMHGYYGSVSHDVKAIYQRYMGWFDGNPANLWQYPPEQVARRYVDAFGGAEQAVATARQAYDNGDYRWVVELLKHVVFANPSDTTAKLLQADAFEQLGYGCENGTWRNFYLMGAYELRNGNIGTPTQTSSPSIAAALSVEQVFEAASFLVNGPKAWDLHLIDDWVITDENTTYRTELHNGVLINFVVPEGFSGPEPDATFTLTRPTLIAVLAGGQDLAEAVKSGRVQVSGDASKLAQLIAVLDRLDPDFDIVTP